nr:hypothetical protein [Acidobacteriota bacterium]
MAPIRVLFVDEVSAPGGGGHSLNLLMRHLSPRFEPVLVGPPGRMMEDARAAGIRVHAHVFQGRYESLKVGRREIPLNPVSLLRRLGDARRIAAIAREESAAIVHTNNLDAHMAGWFLQYVFRYPVIWHIRIHWPPVFYRVPLPVKVIFVSQAVMRASLGSRAGREPRATVVMNGFDPAATRAGQPRDRVLAEIGVPAGAAVI